MERDSDLQIHNVLDQDTICSSKTWYDRTRHKVFGQDIICLEKKQELWMKWRMLGQNRMFG